MMGVVYRAHDTLLDRTVALKTIHLAISVSESEQDLFEQRFFTEARSAARLSHPGIVVVHDVGRDAESGTLFMALEYLKGKTLDTLAAEAGTMEWSEALRLTARVATALHHAHSHGVVHRDVKPANIMVLESGEPKIMDFGIAKLATSQVALTSTGQFFGTPLFMAPEQALGEPVDGRSDLFSLASVTYELLTGLRPFEADNVPRILARVAYEIQAPPSSQVEGLPTDVDYILSRALSKPPGDRHPDGQAMAEDIEDVLASREPRHRAGWTPTRSPTGTMVSTAAHEIMAGTAAGTVSEPAREPGPARHRALALKAGLAVLGLVLGGLGVAWLLPRLQPGSANRAQATAAPTPAASPATRPTATVTPPPTATATPPPAATATPPPATTLAAVTAVATTIATMPTSTTTLAPALARLVIDVEHPLKAGKLRVWIDKKIVREEEFEGEVDKNLLFKKLYKGRFRLTLDLSPGSHDVEVEVRWNDSRRAKLITGNFRSGDPRALRVRLGRIRKNLSLKWQ